MSVEQDVPDSLIKLTGLPHVGAPSSTTTNGSFEVLGTYLVQGYLVLAAMDHSDQWDPNYPNDPADIAVYVVGLRLPNNAPDDHRDSHGLYVQTLDRPNGSSIFVPLGLFARAWAERDNRITIVHNPPHQIPGLPESRSGVAILHVVLPASPNALDGPGVSPDDGGGTGEDPVPDPFGDPGVPGWDHLLEGRRFEAIDPSTVDFNPASDSMHGTPDLDAVYWLYQGEGNGTCAPTSVAMALSDALGIPMTSNEAVVERALEMGLIVQDANGKWLGMTDIGIMYLAESYGLDVTLRIGDLDSLISYLDAGHTFMVS